MISDNLRKFLVNTNQPQSIQFLEQFSPSDSNETQLTSFDPFFLEKIVELLNLPMSLNEYLLEGLQLIKTDSIFGELLVLSHLIIRQYQNLSKGNWPLIPESTYAIGSGFEIYVFLYNVPIMLERYKALGIPEKYAIDVLGDLKIWIEDFFSKHNKFGLDELGWLSNHLNLKTFQIGRLQFEPRLNPLPYYCFHKQDTNQSLVMVKEGLEVRRDGLFNGCNGQFEKEVFTTELNINDEIIKGHAVNPCGFINKKMTTLPRQDWVQILGPTSIVLSLHIPASGALKKELLDSSLEDAKVFFRVYFPEIIFNCFMTKTWFMDPTIATYLPNSNITSFQKSVYLLPIPHANGDQFYERVFGSSKIDLENYLPKTSLQKIGLEHIRKGGHWKMFGFFLFKDDVPLIENLYREQLLKYM